MNYNELKKHHPTNDNNDGNNNNNNDDDDNEHGFHQTINNFNDENKSLNEHDHQTLCTTTEVNTLVDVESVSILEKIVSYICSVSFLFIIKHRLSLDMKVNHDAMSSFYQETVDAMMQVNDSKQSSLLINN
jgi:hypothetical protein